VTATVPSVYKTIAAVMADIAKEGIAKDSRNQQQGYNFRGIDSVYNALAPILSRHGLMMLPRVLAREVVERATKSGGVLFYVTVDVEFTLVCSEDGSAHVIKTYGEAMDSGDKATNKAMSAAYKYAAMQAFCIPTEGDNDPDATTHEVVASRGPDVSGGGPDWWGCSTPGMSASAAKKEGLGEKFDEWRTEIAALTAGAEWRQWCKDHNEEIAKLPKSWRVILREEAEAMAVELGVDLTNRRSE